MNSGVYFLRVSLAFHCFMSLSRKPVNYSASLKSCSESSFPTQHGTPIARNKLPSSNRKLLPSTYEKPGFYATAKPPLPASPVQEEIAQKKKSPIKRKLLPVTPIASVSKSIVSNAVSSPVTKPPTVALSLAGTSETNQTISSITAAVEPTANLANAAIKPEKLAEKKLAEVQLPDTDNVVSQEELDEVLAMLENLKVIKGDLFTIFLTLSIERKGGNN